jgi:hypothetical protein
MKINDFWKGMIVMAVVMLVLGFLFAGYVNRANQGGAPATINNPALAVTPQAGPSPTATPSPSPTPAMSKDQADRFRKAGATWVGAHTVSASDKK